MADLALADLAGLQDRAGVERFEAVPFAEVDGPLELPPTRWRLPWTMLVATMRHEPEWTP